MICITVAPTSRTLAKVDILNAMRYADIVEVALDHLVKEPDVKDLIEGWDKPIIISCRRKEDGGQWDGSEADRLMLLRQAIVAGPDYIELDLEIASRVPRFGKTQRVICFTSMDRPLKDIDSIFDEAAQAQADVVKFCWPTPTLDDAWPLLAAVSQKRRLPIVGLGLGRADLTFSLLGRKYGSPWIYAALERGMEAFSGQATVFELDETYHCREVEKTTSFVAIAGFGPSQEMTTKVFNAAFKLIGANVRCLPIEIGNINLLKKMLDVLKVKAVLASGGIGGQLLPLADQVDDQDRKSGYIDLLMKRDEGWAGFNTLWRSGIKALESSLGGGGGQRPLEKHNVLVIGNGGVANSMAQAVMTRKGLVSVCGPSDKLSQQAAGENGCRFVPFQNLYDTLADVVVIADRNLKCGTTSGCINPSLLRPNQSVLDVTDPPQEHGLFQEARERGCKVIEPTKVYMDQLQMQFKAIAGRDLPVEAYAQGLAQ
jgi:3-dehydroquinate dehydratase/shikimate dehydrogenase